MHVKYWEQCQMYSEQGRHGSSYWLLKDEPRGGPDSAFPGESLFEKLSLPVLPAALEKELGSEFVKRSLSGELSWSGEKQIKP